MIDTTVAPRLIAARERLGITSAELARRSGISARDLWRYEHGRVMPGVGVLVRLAHELGVSMEWIATGRAAPSAA